MNKLTKFHSIFSDDYEKKNTTVNELSNLTDVHYSMPSNKIFVAYSKDVNNTVILYVFAYSMYQAFLFRPSTYWKFYKQKRENFQTNHSDIFFIFLLKT